MHPSIKLVVDGRGYGGIEAHVCQLYHKLKQSGCEVGVVLISSYPDSGFILQLKMQKVAYIELTGPWHQKLIQLKHHHQQGVLHAHGYKASIMCRLATLGSGRPCVTTFHNGDTGGGKLGLYLWADLVSSPLSLNFAVSRAIQARVGGNCQLIRNWVSPASVVKRHFGHPFTFGFAGRLCADKGFDRYVTLANSLPQYHWFGFGDGELASLVEGSNVVHHGQVNDMTRRLVALDALILPSRCEGLPMVALEAMACGIPVIAFDVGDLSQLIDDRVGALVPAGDMKAMAKAVVKVASHSPKTLLEIGTHARERVTKEWSGDASLAQCLTRYHLCLEGAAYLETKPR